MKLFKRGLAVATMAAASVALMGGSASASISPDPYRFSSTDSGTFTSRTILGTSTCRISGLAGTLVGTPTGASGSVTAATISGCSGAILSGSVLPPINVNISSGTVTVTVGLLIRNILGGNCLYQGTLRGTIARGARSITASNSSVALFQRLSGTCTATADANLTVNTGATISW